MGPPGLSTSSRQNSPSKSSTPVPSLKTEHRHRETAYNPTTSNSTSTSPSSSTSPSPHPKTRKRRPLLSPFLPSYDLRSRLPPEVARFTGYLPPPTPLDSDPALTPNAHATAHAPAPPHAPLEPRRPLPFPPFSYLSLIPLQYEIYLLSFAGILGGVWLIEAIMSCSPVFRTTYESPLIITSVGAAAVLLFGVTESPLSQPRNFVGGQVVASVIGVALTRLWALGAGYTGDLDDGVGFRLPTFLSGGLVVAVTTLATQMTGTVHPPAGATALYAATVTDGVRLSWHYIPIILTSAVAMLAWGLIINNVGRRRYPKYWWSPEPCFVKLPAEAKGEDVERGRSMVHAGCLANGTESRGVEMPDRSEAIKDQARAGTIRRAEDGGLTIEAIEEEDRRDGVNFPAGVTHRINEGVVESQGDQRGL